MAGEHDGCEAVSRSARARPPRWRRSLGAALVVVSCLGGCRSAPAVATPPDSPRTILLNPAHPFWAAKAPDVGLVRFETTKGAFAIEVHRAWAPHGADRFWNLVRAGYFDDSRFFRVVAGRFAQFGIAGDSAVSTVWKDRAIPDDPVVEQNVRGTIAFAMTGPNTRTTQLYINYIDNHLAQDTAGFSPIGRVVDGMDIVDLLYSGYGETAGGGMRAGRQGRMLSEGNAHLDREFPKLDRLIRVTVR